jgi:phosphatidylglycerol:prolipoprotein diacylglycerol transferase
VLFSIFGFPIHSYGLMMVIGFMAAAWRASKRAKAVDINPDRVYDIGLIALLSGVLGSRIVFVLLNYQTESLTGLYKVWEGGLSFHGGVIFGMLGGWLYTVRAKLNFWKIADLCAPSIAIAYALTRIGCFLNGCCYGCPTDLPCGVRFLENGTLTPPSHPTQIYASITNLLIFWILTRVEKANLPTGGVFSAYVALYGLYRFLIEFLRSGYSAQLSLLNLTQAQWVSIIMMLAGGLYFLKVAKSRK